MAELEFPKILVPRLPQDTLNVNIKCAGKSKQPYSLCDQLLVALIYLHFINLIFRVRKNIVAVINQDRVIDDNLKRQIKNRILYTCKFFLLI